MLTRWSALSIALVVTLSLTYSWGGMAVFPFMFPVAVLAAGMKLRADAVTTAFSAVAALATVSAVVTGAPFGYAILWAALPFLYLVARYRLPEVLSPRRLAATFAFVVVAVSVLAMYQVWATTTLGSPYAYLGRTLRGLTTVEGDLRQRPIGVFQNSNILGQWLVFSLLLLLPLLRELPRLVRVVVVASALVPLTLTYSRAVWLVAACAAVLLVLRWVASRPGRVSAALVVVALGGMWFMVFGVPDVAAPALPDRFDVGSTLESADDRGSLNDYGRTVAAAHPFVGVGYYQYEGLGSTGIDRLRPHNVFVQVAAEQGYLTALALMLAVLAVAVTCWRASGRVRHDPVLRASLAALPFAWVGFMLVYSSAADYATMPVVVTALGVLLSLVERGRSDGQTAAPVASTHAEPVDQMGLLSVVSKMVPPMPAAEGVGRDPVA